VYKLQLKKARQNKGMSQETLADLIGMTQSNYSRRENGKKNITETEWKKIAKALNVNIEEIYQPLAININPDKIKETELKTNLYNSSVSKYIQSLETENADLKQKIKELKV
jgi:transcriptional regulator with XRE-family HTH domain